MNQQISTSAFSARPAWSASSSSRLLANHPWFKVDVARREPAIRGQAVHATRRHGGCRAACPTTSRSMTVEAATPGGRRSSSSPGLDSSVAGEIEGAFAEAGHIVVSNARNYRMEATVPLLIPEVNADHLALLDRRRAARGWKGRIVTNPNCATIVHRDGAGAAAAVRSEEHHRHHAAGHLRRGLSRACPRGTSSATSFRTSAAAKKRRSRPRPRRSSVRSAPAASTSHPVTLSATTTRVPVQNGHTGSMSVGLDQRPPPRPSSMPGRASAAGRRSSSLPSAPPQSARLSAPS